MKKLTFLIFMLFAWAQLFAQQLSITGKVTDESGEPMPGVNVETKNTTTGTITDLDGNFAIKVEKGKVLTFSFIGYETISQKVMSEKPLSIVMRESSVLVDEVVVTALGIRKEKKALAYSVTEVKSDDLNRVKVSNIANSLVGKVAGVNVVKPATGVMGSSRVTIRGNGSLSGGNQPLYIIDGIPMDNSNYGQAGQWGGSDGGDGISSINSEDIESMSVLKGGTAAALYGSRASNGAIVITTKRGAAGKVKVEYNLSFTKDTPMLKNDDFQWEYGCGVNGLTPNQLAASMAPQYGMTAEQAIAVLAPNLAKQMSVMSYGGKLDGSMVMQYDGVERPYSALGKNNFKDFYDNGWSLNNNVSVSGGNEKIQFRVGAGDQRFHDMQPNSKLERNNITLSLNAKLDQHFSMKANVMYIRERAKNRSHLGDITDNANASLWQLAPNYGLSDMKATNEDGTENEISGSGFVVNPNFVVERYKQSDAKDRVIGSIEAQYNFTPNWYLRGRAGGDMINRRAESGVPWGTALDPEGYISNSSEYHGEFNVEALAGYTNSFKEGLFNVDAFVGWNTMSTWSNSTSASGNDFIAPGFNTINNTKTTSGGHYTSESYINSIFGSAEFAYKSMVYLTLTGRNDWFSTLSYRGKTSPNHIFYPSVGLGFILSEAIQMPSWLPYLKLRGSWAESGGSVGAYNLGLTYGYGEAYRGHSVGSINGSTIPNLNLKPLTSISYEAGFEARFLNNRLGVDFTYYVRNTRDDIVSAGISSGSGYGSVKINAGKLQNRGIELLLTGTPVRTRHFSWDTSFNFSYNKSEIKRITDDITEFILETSRTGHDSDACGPAWIYQEVGEPYGIIKGVSFKRNDKGEIMYKDGLPMKGDIIKLGESVHPYTLGLTNTFALHGFTLSFLIDAKIGGKVYSETNAHMISFGRHKDTLPGREGGVIGQGVKEDGVTPNDVKVEARTYYSALSGITENCVYDASFVKLREVSFGYNFPTSLVHKIGLSGLSLSLVAHNLWNIYDKVPLVDPESSFNNGNAQGFDSYGMPVSRSYGFNLNVKF